MYGYVFQLNYDIDGVVFRRWADCSWALGHTYEGHVAATAAAKRMGLDTSEKERQLSELAPLLAMGKISERFSDLGGTYVVKSEVPLTPDEMQTLLRHKQREGTLKEFLQEAKV